MNPSYALVVTMHIHSCFAGSSSKDVWMERQFFLPFAPTLGLRISDEKWFEHEITELYWKHDEYRFVSYESDKELYERALTEKRGFGMAAYTERLAEKVAEYEEQGWHVRA